MGHSITQVGSRLNIKAILANLKQRSVATATHAGDATHSQLQRGQRTKPLDRLMAGSRFRCCNVEYILVEHQRSGSLVKEAAPVKRVIDTADGEHVEFTGSRRGYIISSAAEVEEVV